MWIVSTDSRQMDLGRYFRNIPDNPSEKPSINSRNFCQIFVSKYSSTLIYWQFPIDPIRLQSIQIQMIFHKKLSIKEKKSSKFKSSIDPESPFPGYSRQ